jgi:hypothetical protein
MPWIIEHPAFLDKYMDGYGIVSDAIYPAIVIQIIGTINWIMILYLFLNLLHLPRVIIRNTRSDDYK